MTPLGSNDTDLLVLPASSHARPRPADDVHVLYIAGMGRSGSTLLCRTLGSVDGLVATGELMHIVGRGLADGDLCSCGSAVRDCELWGRVLEEIERRSPHLDLARLECTRTRITERWDFIRCLFFLRWASTLERDLREYRDFLALLYRSICAVTGARIVVDASKNLFFAKLLTETAGIRVSLIHLVRDSRGVAHSHRRKQQRPGTCGRLDYFPQHGTFVGMVLWSGANMMTEWLRSRAAGFVRVRYEDFVAAPSATVQRILQDVAPAHLLAGFTPMNGASVHLGADHVIASNPNRSQRGEILLREDVAWMHEMSPLRRWITTWLTLPLLRRYGYPAHLHTGLPEAG